MRITKALYISIILVLIIPQILAYSANSTNYKLISQNGYGIYNVSGTYKVTSGIYKQHTDFNLTTTYKVCEGYYCLIKRLVSIITPGGGGGGVTPAEALICKEGETLVYINQTYYCKSNLELRKIIAERDWRNILIILIFLLLLVYLESRRRRKKLEKKLHTQSSTS